MQKNVKIVIGAGRNDQSVIGMIRWKESETESIIMERKRNALVPVLPLHLWLLTRISAMLRSKVFSAGGKVVSVVYLLSCYLSFFLHKISTDHLPCGKVLLSCVLGWVDNASHPHGIYILVGLIWFKASNLEFYIYILSSLWLLIRYKSEGQ